MARWGLLVLALVLVAVPVHAKDTVVIYTALEPEQITDYMKAVNKTLPNLEVKMLRLSPARPASTSASTGPRASSWPRCSTAFPTRC
jgi:hypothetical protein